MPPTLVYEDIVIGHNFWRKIMQVQRLNLFGAHVMTTCVRTRHQIKVFDENIPGFSPYNGLHWEPNGLRSK